MHSRIHLPLLVPFDLVFSTSPQYGHGTFGFRARGGFLVGFFVGWRIERAVCAAFSVAASRAMAGVSTAGVEITSAAVDEDEEDGEDQENEEDEEDDGTLMNSDTAAVLAVLPSCLPVNPANPVILLCSSRACSCSFNSWRYSLDGVTG